MPPTSCGRPCRFIRTTAEVAAQKRDRPASEYLQALDEILEESERTSQVVDSLMLLARADSGREVVEWGPVDMAAIVHNALEQGEKLARNRGLKFSSKASQIPIEIRGDADALRRALLVLIDNAVKYTPEGGEVNVGLQS